MRKIFSAALALVCVWFATPSWANETCRNLYNPSYIYSPDFELVDGNILRNKKTDNRQNARFNFYIKCGDGDLRATTTITSPGEYTAKFTVPNADTPIYFFHSGTITNLTFYAGQKLTSGSYVVSMKVLGTDSRVVGGLQIQDIKIYPAECYNIRVATTKYNESAFSPLNTALANAISVVDSVVSNTITQAASIATLQAQKQTRPADDPSDANNAENCPAGKKCLLVEDASGVPHWYEIVTGRLPDGYTELEYIESTGTQWIDTGVSEQTVTNLEIDFETSNSTSTNGFIFVNGTSQVGVRDARYGLSSPGRYTITESKNNVSAWVVKNETNGTTFTNMQSASPSTLALFNLMNTTGTIGSYYCKDLKIYYFKAYNGNTLVQHLVPAKNPDGVIGMYDTVSGEFFENKGTGEFIGGQPVFN